MGSRVLRTRTAEASNFARACPDSNAILSRYLRRWREGNLDCFGFNSRCHVCEPIDGESVVSSISSLFLVFLVLCSNFRHYRHAHGGI